MTAESDRTFVLANLWSHFEIQGKKIQTSLLHHGSEEVPGTSH
jgi:hypothetical protein